MEKEGKKERKVRGEERMVGRGGGVSEKEKGN